MSGCHNPIIKESQCDCICKVSGAFLTKSKQHECLENKKCECHCHSEWMVCNKCRCKKFKSDQLGLMERLEELEESYRGLFHDTSFLEKTLKELRKEHDSLLHYVKYIEARMMSTAPKPKICGTCQGNKYCNKCNGVGFLHDLKQLCHFCCGSPECKACKGKGIVWD